MPIKKILWIKADPLHPLDSGGKIRTYNMLKVWSRQHDITFLSLYPGKHPLIGKEKSHEYSNHQVWINWQDTNKKSLRFFWDLLYNVLFSTLPYVIEKYTNKTAQKAIQETIHNNNFDLIICDFLSMSQNLKHLKKSTNSTYVLFQHNVESQIWKRHYLTSKNFIKKAFMKLQWKRYYAFEKNMCKWFDGVIAVSKEDEKLFKNEFNLSNVIGNVPTGVDLDYFKNTSNNIIANKILFLGSMDWMPNIEGIIGFVNNCYPLIKKSTPDVTLTIVGRNPTAKIKALADLDKSITVTGTVDDVRPYMQQCAISVVPLNVGGGTRIKIFEIMAMGIPVVSTSIGAEGLPVENGNNIFIADNDPLFAEKVTYLFNNIQEARKIGESAQLLVQQNYTWVSVVEKFDHLCAKQMKISN